MSNLDYLNSKKTYFSTPAAKVLTYVRKKKEVETVGERMYKQTLQKQSELEQKGDLNNWEYCNPTNQQDGLPQPYRFVNRVLNELILQKVYNKVFEIEKYKFNPNYEGNLPEIPPQGSFELSGISSFSTQTKSSHNTLLVGDKAGTVYLLDLSKKTQICKKEIAPGKRIINISSNSIPYGDLTLTTFAVIARADPTIYIYRFLGKENKFYHQFNIRFTPPKLPFKTEISLNCDLISVCLYNGDVLIYEIPEPPQIPKPENVNDDQQIAQKSPKQSTYSISHLRVPSGSIFDFKPYDLEKVYYKIDFPGQLKETKFDDIIQNMKNKQLQQQQQQQAAAQPQPKDPKKGAKKEEEPAKENINQQNLLPPVFEFNEIAEFPPYKANSANIDISDDIPLPKYLPIVKFIKQNVNIPHDKKTFKNSKSAPLVTDLLVAWKGQKTFQLHSLRPAKLEFIPLIIQQSILNNNDLQSNNALKKEQFKCKLLKENSLLYQIECVQMNESCSFCAFGLSDGTVVVWDLQMKAELGYFDKHLQAVKCIEFFENWKVISGSKDGSVHIYDLQKQKLEMKRTNLFQEKNLYEIVNISVSESGIAFVLDSLGNLRLYNMWLASKIARLCPYSLLETTQKSWSLFPTSLINTQKDQMCIISDIFPQLTAEDEQQLEQLDEIEKPIKKQQIIKEKLSQFDKCTNIQIFRTFDLLINIFPGLANVSRKGVEREKLINLFGHLNQQELTNPQFEIPQIGQPAPIRKNTSQGKSAYSSSSQKQSALVNKNVIPATNQSQKGLSNSQKVQQQQQQMIQQQDEFISRASSFDSELDLNSSFRTQLTTVNRNKSISKNSQQDKNAVKLTKEMLNPERFLFEKIKIKGNEYIDPLRLTIQQSRIRNAEKQVRQNKMNNDQQKLQELLEKQEEKRIQAQKMAYLNKQQKK